MSDESLEADAAFGSLKVYAADLALARRSGELAAGEEDPDVQAALLRDMVVSYGRPFSGNHVARGGLKRIPTTWIPESMAALHAELIQLRDRAFAHSDMDFRKPTVTGFVYSPGSFELRLELSDPDLVALRGRWAEVRSLIDAVEARIGSEAGRYTGGGIQFSRGSAASAVSRVSDEQAD